MRADRIIWWFVLVLGCYPCILVLGTGINDFHYLVLRETLSTLFHSANDRSTGRRALITGSLARKVFLFSFFRVFSTFDIRFVLGAYTAGRRLFGS